MSWTAGTTAPVTFDGAFAAPYSGKIYVFGGEGSAPRVHVHIYDPGAGTWTTGTSAPSDLDWLSSACTIGSKIYILGWFCDRFWIYNPVADTWTNKTSGLPSEFGSTGQFSGCTDGSKFWALRRVDTSGRGRPMVYDPSTDTWDTTTYPQIPAGIAPNGDASGAMFRVGNELIYCNGWNASPDGIVGRLDVVTGGASWVAGATNATQLEDFPPTIDGAPFPILIGGDGSGIPDSTSVRLYDPTTDTWSDGPALTTSRTAACAAIVGSVLYVIGGTSGGTALGTVEHAPLSDFAPGLAATGVDDEQGGSGTGFTFAALAAAGAVTDDATGTLDLVLPPPTVPPGMTGTIWQRRSYTYTPPAVDTATGRMVKQQRTLYVAEPWGYTQIVIDGLDRTWHRGVRTRLGPMVWAVPGGPATLTVIFPAARPFEDLAAALAIPRVDGAFIGVYKRHADHSRADDLSWEGLAHAKRPVISGDDWHWEVDVKGFMHQPEDAVNQPPFQIYTAAAQDVGQRVAQVLNSWTGRRYHAIPPVTIGTPTLARGSFGQSRLQMVQDLVAFAWTSDGRQWRVNDVQGPGRRFVIEVPSTAVDYHVSVGGDGVDLSDLVDEGDEAPTVIYGEWVDADGNRSQNVKYPHAHEDTAPPFPLTDPAVFDPGDGHTGFAPFSSWLRAHGAGVIHSGDTYDARDEDDVVAAQKRMGVTPDGVVGRQTWGTAFNTGANVGDLGAVFYAPLAADSRTQPRLYNSDGQDLGPNPIYDATFPCREVKIDFGSGVTRNEVLQAARAMLARNTTGRNFAGEIHLTGDPEEGARWDIRHGRVIAVRYLDNSGSAGVPMHIAQVSWDDPESDDSPVTLTVDSRYRDAPTLTQILQNRREAKNDPARILRRQETGKLTQSTRTPFDKDNAAGRIFTHAIQGGYWRVVQFPAAAYGEFVDLVATTSPAQEFVLGLFVKPVTANFMASRVGNPLDPANKRPFDVNRADLKAAGLIQGWGSGAQPGGYSSSYTGAKTFGDSLTGRIEDDQSTKYAAFNPPWLYLVEYASGNTNITATFLNAPELV